MRFLRSTGGKLGAGALLLVIIFGWHLSATAATQTKSHSINVTATVPGPPPTSQAIITSPATNTTFTVTPLVVSGTCEYGLLVKVFNNADLVGSTSCQPNGTFTINMTLQAGRNELTALSYDTLDQAGPASASVIVFVNTPFSPSSNRSGTGNYRPGQESTTPGEAPNGSTPPGSSGNSDGNSRLEATYVHATWILFIVLWVLGLILFWRINKKRRTLR